MQNGHRTLDLSEFVGKITVTLGDLTFDLPQDMPMTLLTRIARVFERIGKAAESDVEGAAQIVADREAEMWAMVEEIMVQAEPSLTVPVREAFTTSAAVQLLSFLVRVFRDSTSTTPSPSPGSTGVPSASETS